MDEKTLALLLYEHGVAMADENEAPRSAIAAAMIRAGMQLYIESEGADRIVAWLQREAKAMRDAIN